MMKGYMPTYEEIVKNTGTPAYVFDTDVLRKRILHIKNTLGENINLCYAMKANPFVVGSIGDEIDRYEVCSPGEFRICERAEVDIDKVVLSGVWKEDKDTARIIKAYGDKILYTAESENQFKLVNSEAEKNGIVVNVILRVTTGNQFGIDEEKICEIIANRAQYKGVNIRGIQHFSGTQRHNLKIYKEEIDFCDNFIERLEREYGYVAEELEFGTGFFVDYFRPKTEREKQKQLEKGRFDEEALMRDFANLLADMKFKGEITLEIGRFIAAYCGKYYTSVVDDKVNHGIHFCIADGGMHQVNYYGQMMGMKLPYYRQLKATGEIYDGGTDKINLCGALCTINDNIVKEMLVTDAKKGDIFEFQNVGAYSMTETPALFLSRDLPKVYLYSQSGGLKLMRDRFETDALNYL